MTKPLLLLMLLVSSLSWASPNDGDPIFQSQLLNVAGTTVVDPLARDWTLNSSTDSVTAAVSGVVSTKTPLTANAATAVSIGITSGVVLLVNASRKGLVLINLSANKVSFGIGAAATLNTGITLLPGGTWYMDEYTFSTAAINGIASVASSVVSVQEFQ